MVTLVPARTPAREWLPTQTPPKSHPQEPQLHPTSPAWQGGYQPGSYNWGSSISNNATDLLNLILFIDNVLLEVLVNVRGWEVVAAESVHVFLVVL